MRTPGSGRLLGARFDWIEDFRRAVQLPGVVALALGTNPEQASELARLDWRLRENITGAGRLLDRYRVAVEIAADLVRWLAEAVSNSSPSLPPALATLGRIRQDADLGTQAAAAALPNSRP